MAEKLSVFWFRRDLRLVDNHGLYQALMSGNKVLPIFIFDTEILSQLENKEDRRVDFIFQALNNINDELQKTGKSIQIFHGKPLEVFQKITDQYSIAKVYCNEDYEPSAIKRDRAVAEFLKTKNIDFQSLKDQVHF
ncbi:MAG: deoxyribodipyrimidine photo-lyase, partial [Kaistella sp.]